MDGDNWGGGVEGGAEPPVPGANGHPEYPFHQAVLGLHPSMSGFPQFGDEMSARTRRDERPLQAPVVWDATHGGSGQRLGMEIGEVHIMGNVSEDHLRPLHQHALYTEARMYEMRHPDMRSLSHCSDVMEQRCRMVQNADGTMENHEDGSRDRVMRAEVHMGRLPLAPRRPNRDYSEPHPGLPDIPRTAAFPTAVVHMTVGPYATVHTTYITHEDPLEQGIYEAVHPCNGVSPAEYEGHWRVSPSTEWRQVDGAIWAAMHTQHSYVEYHYYHNNMAMFAFEPVVQGAEEHTVVDVFGNVRRVIGYALGVEYQVWGADGMLLAAYSWPRVPVLAGLEGGLAAAFAAELGSGAIGADVLGAAYILPNRWWTGAGGVERRGVLMLHPPGAPGLVLPVGLLDVRLARLHADSWHMSAGSMAALSRAVAELVMHTSWPQVRGMGSVLSALDMFMRLRAQRARFSEVRTFEYRDNRTGERDASRDTSLAVTPLRATPMYLGRQPPRPGDLVYAEANVWRSWVSNHRYLGRPHLASLTPPSQRVAEQRHEQELAHQAYMLAHPVYQPAPDAPAESRRALVDRVHAEAGGLPLVNTMGGTVAAWENQRAGQVFVSPVTTADVRGNAVQLDVIQFRMDVDLRPAEFILHQAPIDVRRMDLRPRGNQWTVVVRQADAFGVLDERAAGHGMIEPLGWVMQGLGQQMQTINGWVPEGYTQSDGGSDGGGNGPAAPSSGGSEGGGSDAAASSSDGSEGGGSDAAGPSTSAAGATGHGGQTEGGVAGGGAYRGNELPSLAEQRVVAAAYRTEADAGLRVFADRWGPEGAGVAELRYPTELDVWLGDRYVADMQQQLLEACEAMDDSQAAEDAAVAAEARLWAAHRYASAMGDARSGGTVADLVSSGDVRPVQLVGSWEGAMGGGPSSAGGSEATSGSWGGAGADGGIGLAPQRPVDAAVEAQPQARGAWSALSVRINRWASDAEAMVQGPQPPHLPEFEQDGGAAQSDGGGSASPPPLEPITPPGWDTAQYGPYATWLAAREAVGGVTAVLGVRPGSATAGGSQGAPGAAGQVAQHAGPVRLPARGLEVDDRMEFLGAVMLEMTAAQQAYDLGLLEEFAITSPAADAAAAMVLLWVMTQGLRSVDPEGVVPTEHLQYAELVITAHQGLMGELSATNRMMLFADVLGSGGHVLRRGGLWDGESAAARLPAQRREAELALAAGPHTAGAQYPHSRELARLVYGMYRLLAMSRSGRVQPPLEGAFEVEILSVVRRWSPEVSEGLSGALTGVGARLAADAFVVREVLEALDAPLRAVSITNLPPTTVDTQLYVWPAAEPSADLDVPASAARQRQMAELLVYLEGNVAPVLVMHDLHEQVMPETSPYYRGAGRRLEHLALAVDRLQQGSLRSLAGALVPYLPPEVGGRAGDSTVPVQYWANALRMHIPPHAIPVVTAMLVELALGLIRTGPLGRAAGGPFTIAAMHAWYWAESINRGSMEQARMQGTTLFMLLQQLVELADPQRYTRRRMVRLSRGSDGVLLPEQLLLWYDHYLVALADVDRGYVETRLMHLPGSLYQVGLLPAGVQAAETAAEAAAPCPVARHVREALAQIAQLEREGVELTRQLADRAASQLAEERYLQRLGLGDVEIVVCRVHEQAAQVLTAAATRQTKNARKKQARKERARRQ